MTTTHITPEHKTLVVALHAGVTHSKLFDENAKTHALVHPAVGSVSWRSSACTRKSVLDRGFVSVKCRVYRFKPRYTVTAVINGTRCAAHVDRLGGHFMQIQESVYWFASKNASKSWQERGCAMIAPEQIEDRGVTVRVQADAVLARLAPVTTEPAAPVTTAPAPVTTEPAAPAPVTEAPAAPAPLAPVELGTSPAGVEWVVYPKSTETADQFHARVQVGRERLAALHAKQAPASLAPVTVGRWNELTLYPRAGESAAVFHARVEQEHARLLGATPAKEPTLHRDALAHLQGLDEVTYDYLVDAYAEAVDRGLSRTPAHEWTEERAEECLDCSALEDQDWHPPRTCDTWQDVYALIREAYELAAAE